MKLNRRAFLTTSLGATAFAGLSSCSGSKTNQTDLMTRLDEALAKPVLKKELFREPIILSSLELLHNRDEFIVRVRTKDGAEGLALSNNAHMNYLYPLLVRRVFPPFQGKDARELENLLEEVYVWNSNYKLQGLCFWLSVASVELAILDLLGKIANRPVGELVGEIVRNEVAVYRANGDRDITAEETVAILQEYIAETGAKAVKYKVGGRMRNNADLLPGRTEKLIPLVRKVLGDDVTIYADSNGSYDIPHSIRIGRMLEETRAGFFEEPCPFDWYEETKEIADQLMIPIAGGEQDSSMRRFRWMIGNDCLQVVQPDLFYYGGMIRSIRVARMAQTAGIPCTPHISGSGLGYLYMLHFASCVSNIGPYQEYKGFDANVPFHSETSDLICKDGLVKVPAGPGLGVSFDRNFIEEAEIIKI